MFERFTDRARRTLVLAQEEARVLGHSFIGTEHLLLGLIHEDDGVAAQTLQGMGISLLAARAMVEQTIGPDQVSGSTGAPPFTPRAKKVLEYSLREALQLGHNYIGTEHILLGLVREGEGVAAQVLIALGADLSTVRQQVIQQLSGFQSPPGAPAESGPVAALLAPTGDSRRGRLWRRATTVRPGQRGSRPRRQPEPGTPWAFVSGEVDLTQRDDRVTGTVAGEPVDLALMVPHSEGSAEGTFAGAQISVTWRLAANGEWQPDVPASLHGTYGGAQVRLSGWFHLPDLRFDHGRVEGEIDGEPIAVYVEPADPAGDAGSFAADGYFAEVGFSLSGVATPGEAVLNGAVAGRPVELAVESGEGPDRVRTLKGTYEGPAPLLLLLAGALLFFG